MGGASWFLGCVVALAGLCFVGTMICLGTEILLTVPDNFPGRVSSFQQICFRTAQPVGSLLAGYWRLGKELASRYFALE